MIKDKRRIFIGIDNCWKVLFLVFLCKFTFGVVVQSVPPIISLLITEIGISHTQAGFLMSIFALPGIIISLPGGLLSDYYGARIIAMLGFLLLDRY